MNYRGHEVFELNDNGIIENPSLQVRDKGFIPFEFVPGTDALGFTADEKEQQVEHPFHCNVPTRIFFDSTTHNAYLQRDVDGRTSILLVPKEEL